MNAEKELRLERRRERDRQRALDESFREINQRLNRLFRLSMLNDPDNPTAPLATFVFLVSHAMELVKAKDPKGNALLKEASNMLSQRSHELHWQKLLADPDFPAHVRPSEATETWDATYPEAVQ